MKNFRIAFFDVLRNHSLGMAGLVVAILIAHYIRRNALDARDIMDAIVAFFLIFMVFVSVELLRLSKNN